MKEIYTFRCDIKLVDKELDEVLEEKANDLINVLYANNVDAKISLNPLAGCTITYPKGSSLSVGLECAVRVTSTSLTTKETKYKLRDVISDLEVILGKCKKKLLV